VVVVLVNNNGGDVRKEEGAGAINITRFWPERIKKGV
jgi:hypothetical protein